MIDKITNYSPMHTYGDKRVRIEQVKTLYESIASLVLINLVVSSALLLAFWDMIAHGWLLGWMAAMILMLCVRLAIYYAFKRGFDESKLKRYQTFLILGSASAGILWGAGGLIMFVPGQLEYQLLILLSLLAMSSGSAFSLSMYLPAYFAFVPVMLAPITARLLLIGDAVHIALGSVTLIFFLAQTIFNIKINKSLSSAMSLRFENLELIDQLQVQKSEAEQANSAKSRFLAAASHDLRQPLYALTLFTAALKERVVAPDAKNVTDQIQRSVDTLQSLFEALLDISRLDAGTVDIRKSEFSLQTLLDKLANEFDPLATERNLSIHWPQCPAFVRSDPILLEQILRNYIANAVRYTNEGRVTVACEPVQSRVKINVTDSGMGIPLAQQSIIFEEFYQLENSERDRQKGLGLGLSIVQRAASQLGHEIDVVSTPGLGSTFSVTVDKGHETNTDLTVATPSAPGKSIDAELLIVVIDDEESIREGIKQLLSTWGCDTVASAHEKEAIAELTAHQRKPDGIISDFRLRDGHTGLAAIDAIHAAFNSTIPALIVTGDTEKTLLVELRSSGHQVLHKPVPPAKLRAFLRSLTSPTPRGVD